MASRLHPAGWAGRGAAAALFVAASTVLSWSEDITLSGFYPAPRAVYETIDTVGLTDLANTPPARLDIGPPGYGWAPEKVNVNGTVQSVEYIGIGAPPTGVILIAPGGCPPGWAAVGAWANRIIRGGPGFGAVGGADTHTHSIDHVHGLAPQLVVPSSVDGAHFHSGINLDHPHFAVTGASDSGTTSICCDQGCGAFEQCREAARDSHTHDFAAGVDPVFMTVDTDTQGDHPHTFDVTWTSVVEPATTDAVSNWPSYLEIALCAAP